MYVHKQPTLYKHHKKTQKIHKLRTFIHWKVRWCRIPWTGYIVTHHGVTCYKNANIQLLQK